MAKGVAAVVMRKDTKGKVISFINGFTYAVAKSDWMKR